MKTLKSRLKDSLECKLENKQENKKTSKLKSQKGITLVALVVTIIILLILAGITITVLFSDNGIIKKAQDAGEKSRRAEAKTKLDLAMADWQIVKRTEDKTFERHLKDTFGDENVTPNGDSFDVKIDGYIFTVKDDGTVTQVGVEKEIEPLGQEFEYLFEWGEDGQLKLNSRYGYYTDRKGIQIFDKDGNQIYDIVIPNKVGGKYVKTIPSRLFAPNFYSKSTKLNSIVISEGIEILESEALYDCGSITSITLPNSLKEIGSYAFGGASISNIKIPDGVKTISASTFSGCSALENIDFSEETSWVGAIDFADCYNLQSISIPEGPTSIAYGGFSNCESLTSFNIPNSVTSIGKEAFKGSSLSGSITIPDTVTEIGADAFTSCKLEEVVVGSGVESMSFAFSDNNNLKSVIIKGKIVDSYAFRGCSSLTNVVLQDRVEIIENNAFEKCSNLTKIFIPKSVITIDNTYEHTDTQGNTTIEGFAYNSPFYGCKSLTIYCEDAEKKSGWKRYWNTCEYDVKCPVEYGYTREQFDALDT